MPGPGEYRPDPTEGITRVDDLPKPKIRVRSRLDEAASPRDGGSGLGGCLEWEGAGCGEAPM